MVACALCGSTDHRLVFPRVAHQIRRCASCRFLFNASFRGGGEEGDTFAADYFLDVHGAAFAAQREDPRNDPSLSVYSRRLDQIAERLAPVRPGRLLDVGPGLGSFLRLARDRGWQAEGVEISRFAAEHIRETHGIPVFHGDLADFPGVPGSFDLITFWDSLEHLARPRENLARAFSLLRPGGLLLIATDNFDCLVADLAAILCHLTRGRLRYPVKRVFIDRNLAYFTAESLSRLLAETGFTELWREKMEYPLDKIRTNLLERLALRALYAAAVLLGRQAQITLLAARLAPTSGTPAGASRPGRRTRRPPAP